MHFLLKTKIRMNKVKYHLFLANLYQKKYKALSECESLSMARTNTLNRGILVGKINAYQRSIKLFQKIYNGQK